MSIGKNLGKVALDCVEIKVNLVKLGHGIVDEVLEKSLDELVASTETPFDDQAKALIYPVLEPKLKELIEKHLGEVQAKLDKAIEDLKASVQA